MKSHKDALVHHAASEWARGTQHRANPFSQLKIQASGLNYACKRTVDSSMERNTIQKRLSFGKSRIGLSSVGLDGKVVPDFPQKKFYVLLIKVKQIPHEGCMTEKRPVNGDFRQIKSCICEHVHQF